MYTGIWDSINNRTAEKNSYSNNINTYCFRNELNQFISNNVLKKIIWVIKKNDPSLKPSKYQATPLKKPMQEATLLDESGTLRHFIQLLLILSKVFLKHVLKLTHRLINIYFI
jgi:hypothetical protein